MFCVVRVEKRRPESLMSDRGRWASPDWPSAQSLLLVATFILHHWYVTSRSSEKHICFHDNKTAIMKTCILVWSFAVVYQCYFCVFCYILNKPASVKEKAERRDRLTAALFIKKAPELKKRFDASVKFKRVQYWLLS